MADADLDLPPRCCGWTVRDQIAHLADIDEVAAHTVRGGQRSFERIAPAARRRRVHAQRLRSRRHDA
ncbi:maleylpyruvate isomerase N-terminal domain-containing protein [Skermania pinensis]|uniref:maleylpyruvate isomerase N-terminal domain-containing protein n=1 Tax=Skermania pinensis TaxID=39122 RepID=UPI0035716E2B